MFENIAALSHILCALAYLLVCVLLISSRAKHAYKALLVTACGTTALWAALVAGAQMPQMPILQLEAAAAVVEQLRNVALVAAVGHVLFVAYGKRFDPIMEVSMAVVGLGAALYVAVASVAQAAGWPIAADPRIAFTANILVAIVALLLIENLFRNSGEESRWAVKYLCFALGTIFVFDFFFYAKAALYGQIDGKLLDARGIICVIAAPLIVLAAARSRNWPIDLHVSRRLVFHSATLIVAGGYLLIMAGVAQSLMTFATPLGSVIQTTFVVAALLLLAVALSSRAAREYVKNFINKNFFSYKYDYRQEWLRFLGSISDSLDELSIPARILRSIANVVDSPAGALWMYRDEDDAFIQIESWNMSTTLPSLSPSEPMVSALAAGKQTIDLKNLSVEGRKDESLVIPDWLSGNAKAWLLVPLAHRNVLIGFLLLAQPRAQRRLDWEDFDLLRTVGQQAASYLAEENASRSLARARRFEEFNRQFAFVIHDIKNIAGQMSLILKNAERHGSSPEFQADVLATVADSLASMQAMLRQLRRTPAAPASTRLDLVPLLQRISANWRMQMPTLRVDLPESPVDVVGDPDRLSAVFNHLLQNAIDAAGTDGDVSLALSKPGADATANKPWAIVTVADDGPGMDEAFIRDRLFQPMESTKSDGFGIGAYQTQHVIREMGGNLEVDSNVGVGTRIVLRLPLAAAA